MPVDIGQFLNEKPRPWILFFGFLLVLLFGLLDYLTGPELSLSIFYFLPIYLTTWYVGRRAGLITAILSVLSWVAADFLIGHAFSSSFVIYWNIMVRLGFFLITTNLISNLKVKLSLEERLARLDYLTQVSNRRRFIEVASLEIARVKRSLTPFTVIYLDLDNFKEVNDTYGHPTGDHLLRLVAHTMKKYTRRIDTVARIGGDEFAILLPEAGKEAASGFIRKLQKVLQKGMQEKNWPVTFSISAITYFQPPKTVDEMMKDTDKLLYMVKGMGKDRFHHEVFSWSKEDG